MKWAAAAAALLAVRGPLPPSRVPPLRSLLSPVSTLHTLDSRFPHAASAISSLEDTRATPISATEKMPRATAAAKKRSSSAASVEDEEHVDERPTEKTAKKTRSAKTREQTAAKHHEPDESAIASGEEDTKKLTKRDTLGKGDAHPRDPIAPVALPTDQKFVKILSWNVNGFKALLAGKLKMLTDMVEKHSPDVICLQETKLQTTQVADLPDFLPGYDAHWHCSTDKKGYSGTAFLIKKASFSFADNFSGSAGSSVAAAPARKQAKLSAMWAAPPPAAPTVPTAAAASNTSAEAKAETSGPKLRIEKLTNDFSPDFSGEGRVMTLETDQFFLVGAYVPNAGEGLVRLPYRVNEWDPAFSSYLHHLSASKPVILTGDLNVGHQDLDIHNPTAKHIAKQAGLTPQERGSFTQFLSTGSFRDTFRFFYPSAVGQFSYWSQRTFARPVNRGIRLDYFICSKHFFPADESAAEVLQERDSSARVNLRAEDVPVPGAADCYILPDVGGSDHCPVMLTVRIA